MPNTLASSWIKNALLRRSLSKRLIYKNKLQFVLLNFSYLSYSFCNLQVSVQQSVGIHMTFSADQMERTTRTNAWCVRRRVPREEKSPRHMLVNVVSLDSVLLDLSFNFGFNYYTTSVTELFHSLVNAVSIVSFFGLSFISLRLALQLLCFFQTQLLYGEYRLAQSIFLKGFLQKRLPKVYSKHKK